MQKSLAGLSLRDLEYVEAVAELRHFGRAAERCGVSQPALSEQIGKLEAHLGITLFERARRRVALTAQGETLLAQIERVLAEARHFLAMGRKSQAGLSGLLQIGAIETLGPYYLPAMLRLLRGALPEVQPRFTENRTAALIERLRHGVLDTILIATPAELPGLASAALFFEPFVLATPMHHPLATLSPLTLDSLPFDDLLLLEEGHCLRDQALALCGPGAPGAPAAARHGTGLETLWHMIAAGEGFSLLPALAIVARPDLAAQVHCRALPEPEAGRDIALVWRASDPREAQFKALAAMLREHAPPEVKAEVKM